MSRASGEELLEAGHQLHVVRASAPHEVELGTVERIQNGLIWLIGCEHQGRPGERVTMECRLADAIYRADGCIESATARSWALRLTSGWQRVQRREHVRVPVRGVDVALVDDESGAPLAKAEMLDLSSGGAKLALGAAEARELTSGAVVRCRFTLRDAGDFDLRAQLLRVIEPADHGRPGSAALRWLNLDADAESELTRWVRSEQMRLARWSR